MKAEEFLRNAKKDANNRWTAKKMLIEFANYHVQKALKEASENATLYDIDDDVSIGKQYYGDNITITINKDSILNSYPLKNIK